MADPADIPHLDEIEGWPLPEAQTEWRGDAGAETALIEAYASGRMHHAWLIGGTRGSGKATLAYRFARFALAHPTPEAAAASDRRPIDAGHPVARKIAARSHPNVLTLARPWDDRAKRFKTDLSVDEVRRTVGFFGSTAGEAGWRIAIVDAADDMNANSANALLKVLEEPPPRSLFLVLSHQPGRLLPTIRSRCRRLELPPLAPDVIAAALAAHEPEVDAADRALAAHAAEGSLRRAISMLRGEGVAVRRDFGAIAARLPDLDIPAAHRLGDLVAQRGATDALEAFVDTVRDWLARRVRGDGEPDGMPVSAAVAATPLASFAEVWEKFGDAAARTEALNLDKKQFVLSTLMDLARATRM
ncbi:DNA polymerase III subunit delta' [Prosthecomicrobium pneumaticum]|uniref:DNA polymerase-3 subunit delta n=1 Tax=Prosthecomicrobium pneumaticum TaxID=81895 RepID=A0A7W9FKP8_9HYPH|nr:DNA polymerase III subunit delta' [Prosthecomicrobium pneumaticum]MBB5751258.1 DNA polymerase-3 subunit delta' [Prosthecomicrobium pneumaticum]